MGKSKSSGRWLREHFNDPFVKKAQKEGYRSRAVYKLIEIQERDKLIKPKFSVVDLGAAPGGWAQYAATQVGTAGAVIALDLLEMEPINGVQCIQGDFTDESVYQQLLDSLDDQVDLVISDMAPNLSGIKAVDQPRMVYLAELACEFAERTLTPDGVFLTKIFQGEGVDHYYRHLRERFSRVVTRKPKASRARSREIYVLAKGYKL